MKLTQTLLSPDRSTTKAPVVVRITHHHHDIMTERFVTVEVKEAITDNEFALAATFTWANLNDQLRDEYRAVIMQCARAVFGLARDGRVAASNSEVSEMMDLVGQHI